MMASLSREQREQLGQLMSDALQDPDLASQMAQLSDNLRALRPGLDRRGPVQQGQGGEHRGSGAQGDARTRHRPRGRGGVMATAAAMFERVLQNAVDIKSENDLTV